MPRHPRHDRPGRPALAPELRRGGGRDTGGRQLGVRLNAAEWAEVERRADAVGLAAATYARHLLLGGRPPALPAPVPGVNRDAWAELGRLAANLNQLAARVNAGHVAGLQQPDRVLVARVGAEVQALRGTLLGRPELADPPAARTAAVVG